MRAVVVIEVLRIAGRYFFTVAAGPELDAGIAAARTGSLSPGGTMSNGSERGFMGELGLRYVAGRIAVGIGLRYTAIDYGRPAIADASSSGLVLAVLLLW